LAKGIKIDSNRKEWITDLETNIEPKLKEMAKQKAEDMREEYADVVIPSVLETLVLSGLVDAEQLFGEIKQMFLPEEWNRNPQDGKKPSISARIATNIATKLAETDPQASSDFAQKFIPPKFRDEATRTINANITAANAQQERARKEQREAAGRQIYGDMLLFQSSGGKEGRNHKPSDLTGFYQQGLLDKTEFDSLMKIASGEEINQEQQDASYREASSAAFDYEMGRIDLATAKERYFKVAPDLETEDKEGIWERLHSSEAKKYANDAESLDGLITSMKSLNLDRIKADKSIPMDEELALAAQYVVKLTRLQDSVLKSWRDHPDWTTRQRLDEMQAILAPAKEEEAKKVVKASLWSQYMGLWSVNMPYGSWAPSQAAQVPNRATQNPSPTTIEVGRTITNKTTGKKLRWDGTAWQPTQ
ncbi:MAG: hypothetical protein WC455_29315, partial [Dehalococcoidia bacterium]